MQERIRVSKFLSYILRHNPYKFGLKLDRYGFANLNLILKILNKKFPDFGEKDLKQLVSKDEKGRFEIKENKIRARYGHSIDVEPIGDGKEIPGIVYHGTAKKNLDSILKEGLKSQGRKFVHLSIDIESAIRVGKRKDSSPAILKIDLKKAQNRGVKFWREGKVILSREIPPDCISIYTNLFHPPGGTKGVFKMLEK